MGKQVFQPWQASPSDPESTYHWGGPLPSDSPAPKPTSHRLGWIGLLVAVALSGTVAWQVAHRPASILPPHPPARPAHDVIPSIAPADLARQAAERVRAFLATTSIDERAAFVRHPEITRSRMQGWHTDDRPLHPLNVLSFHERWAEELVGPHTFVMLYMEMADFTTRAIALERHPTAGLLVDWESFESWSEIPWSDFLTSPTNSPVEFRVVVEYDTYYNFEFADPKAWSCFRVSDPANQAHAWGYCPVESPAAVHLGHLLRRQRRQGTTQAKAIVSLRSASPDPARRQFTIESFVQDNWLKPDP
ncbi:MAG: hypothetical protein ACKV19_12910 [Verrucomicrobiales bacterium]